MIFYTDKEMIIKFLGKQPSRKIRPYLRQKKCLNNKGTEFSPKSIQNIINGEYENIEVETHIYQLIAIEKTKQENCKKLKQKLN